ncbi:MAG: hypothetical protein KC550_02730 [Nanoarchaeota archaeon]|nr:hypothetical protein [Nanoarchaeota archaeon]
MNPTKIRVYDLVKNVLMMNKDQYLKVSEIAFLGGLNYEQVERIIKIVYKIGWVERISYPFHNNAFGKGMPSLRTAYKIKRTESWIGLRKLYDEVLRQQNATRNKK